MPDDQPIPGVSLLNYEDRWHAEFERLGGPRLPKYVPDPTAAARYCSSGFSRNEVAAQADRVAEQGLLDEIHLMLRNLTFARMAIAGPEVTQQLIFSIHGCQEPDETAVRIRVEERHTLTLCTLGELRGIARAALLNLPIASDRRQEIEAVAAHARDRERQAHANAVKKQVLDLLIERLRPKIMSLADYNAVVGIIHEMAKEPHIDSNHVG